MKKLILVAILVTLAAGCGKVDHQIAKLTGYSNVCVDGVSYLQFPSGVTVKLGLDGKPIACSK